MVYSPVCNNSQQLSRLSGMGHGRTQITGFISGCDLVHCMIHLERLAEKQFFGLSLGCFTKAMKFPQLDWIGSISIESTKVHYFLTSPTNKPSNLWLANINFTSIWVEVEVGLDHLDHISLEVLLMPTGSLFTLNCRKSLPLWQSCSLLLPYMMLILKSKRL